VSRRINLPHLHSHTGSVLHGGVSEVMASCSCRSFRSTVFSYIDSVGKAAAATPLDVSVLLLCPRCCGAASDIIVEQGGFVHELSGNCDLWSWRRRRTAEDGNPEAWKVVRGWRICHDLSTMLMGGGGSGAGKTRGRSPVDVPQRYVPCRPLHAQSSDQKALMAMVFPWF
jgi:hypothetical protein